VDATIARRFALVHGDSSPKNVLFYDDRLVLLDLEVIHLGDGAFDVGFALSHLLCKAYFVTRRSSDYRDAALRFWRACWARVAEMPWAGDLELYCVPHALGCLLAGVRGKSPLEYLTPSQRGRQRAIVLEMMRGSLVSVVALIEQFLEGMNVCSGSKC
jgi:hypothetical protein